MVFMRPISMRMDILLAGVFVSLLALSPSFHSPHQSFNSYLPISSVVSLFISTSQCAVHITCLQKRKKKFSVAIIILVFVFFLNLKFPEERFLVVFLIIKLVNFQFLIKVILSLNCCSFKSVILGNEYKQHATKTSSNIR